MQCYNDHYSGIRSFNVEKIWRKKWISSIKSLLDAIFFIHFFGINYLKIRQNAPFWGNIPKISRGRPPGPPPAGGGDPLPHPPPFGASRLSEAFGFRPWCSSNFKSCSRGKKFGHPWKAALMRRPLHYILLYLSDFCVRCTWWPHTSLASKSRAYCHKQEVIIPVMSEAGPGPT